MHAVRRALCVILLLATGCSTRAFVAGRLDAGSGVDAPPLDAAPSDDASLRDGAPDDAAGDAGARDAGSTDGGAPDARPTDANVDAGPCGRGAIATDLYAVHPPLAEEGQTIWLEGRFEPGENYAIRFPGVMLPVIVCATSGARVSLTVPVGTGAGVITAGGATQVAFRAVSFRIGLSSFRGEYDQTAFARGMPSLESGRSAGATAVTASAFYAIGGDIVGGDRGVSTMEELRVHADSALGVPRAVSPPPLAGGRGGGVGLWIGERFCLIGGDSADGTPVTSVECAALTGADEHLGAFAIQTGSMLPEGRRDPAAVVVGRHVYLFGGRDAAVVGARSVLRAPLDGVGALIGGWEDAGGLTLEADFGSASAAVVGETVYVVGTDGAAATFPIDTEGDLGAPTLTTGDAANGASAVEVGTTAFFVASTDGRVLSVRAGPTASLETIRIITPAIAERAFVGVVGNDLHIVSESQIVRASLIDPRTTLRAETPIARGGAPVIAGSSLHLATPGIGMLNVQSFDRSGALIGAVTTGVTITASPSGQFIAVPLGSDTAPADVVAWVGGVDCDSTVDSFMLDASGRWSAGRSLFLPADVPAGQAFLRFAGGFLLELRSADSSCSRATPTARVASVVRAPFLVSPPGPAGVAANLRSPAYVDTLAWIAVATNVIGTTDGTMPAMRGCAVEDPTAFYVLGDAVHLVGSDSCARLAGSAYTAEPCPGGDTDGSPPRASFVVGNRLYLVTASQLRPYLLVPPPP